MSTLVLCCCWAGFKIYAEIRLEDIAGGGLWMMNWWCGDMPWSWGWVGVMKSEMRGVNFEEVIVEVVVVVGVEYSFGWKVSSAICWVWWYGGLIVLKKGGRWRRGVKRLDEWVGEERWGRWWFSWFQRIFSKWFCQNRPNPTTPQHLSIFLHIGPPTARFDWISYNLD